MKLNINQIDLLQNLTKVENNTFWELVKLADENKRIILDMDEKEKVRSILKTTIGNLNKTLCNLWGVLEISCQSDKIQILRVENARRKTNRF